MFARATVAAFAALVAATAPIASAQSPAATEIVSLDMSGPRPIAMLAIGSRPPVPVIFDTGASGNVIDLEYAREIGLPEEGAAAAHTPAGETAMRGFRTTIAQGRLGGASLNNVHAVALPMPALRTLSVQGVFGPGTFAGRLVHLDLGRGEIRITDKTPALIPSGPASSYSSGGRVPGLPGVSVEIAGRNFDGHIDTGQPGTLVLPLALASEVPLEGPLRQSDRPARFGDGVPHNIFDGRIRGIVRIGPLTLENPEVRFMEGLQRVNVGVQALRGLTIVLDPAERRSWLVPAS